MDPASAFILVSTSDVAKKVREALTRVHALVWSNGTLLAARVPPTDLQSILAPIADEREVRVYPGLLPVDVFESLPRATQVMVNAQQHPQPKRHVLPGGLAWDTFGMQAPRYLKKQG